MLKIIIITSFFLGLGIFGMSLSIIFRRKGRFPAFQVGHNRDMKKLGIKCVKHEELKCHREKLKGTDCEGCSEVIKTTS